MLALGIGAAGSATRAEDPTPKKDEPPAAAKQEAPPKEAAKKKDPFWGDKFAMYLEVRGGPASIERVKNPLDSPDQQRSDNSLTFNSNKSGQFTAGWTLPRGRGQYLLTYTGIADGDYELNGSGLQERYNSGGGTNVLLGYQVPWWNVTVRNGQLHSVETPPVWIAAIDDKNGNGLPDPDEFRYPTKVVDITATIPKDLGNRVETWDLYYRREYGGVKIRARWTAGIRYLKYDGAILTPAWLTGVVGTPGFGYSDGVIHKFLLMQQSTSGFGPVGSGEVQFHFFRQHLTLYGMIQAAFLDERLDTTSEDFTYLAAITTSSNFVPRAGTIGDKVNKTAWNNCIELGIRVKVVEGFHIFADWNKTGYLDTIMMPTSISLPPNAIQDALGATAHFVSRDFVVSSVNLGLSFQF
jgi:hypothetical protein